MVGVSSLKSVGANVGGMVGVSPDACGRSGGGNMVGMSPKLSERPGMGRPVVSPLDADAPISVGMLSGGGVRIPVAATPISGVLQVGHRLEDAEISLLHPGHFMGLCAAIVARWRHASYCERYGLG